MTSATYENRYGDVEAMEVIWKASEEAVSMKKEPLNKVYSQMFQPYAEAKENEIRQDIESKGGKVLTMISQPINKRRYKRKVAKILKRSM